MNCAFVCSTIGRYIVRYFKRTIRQTWLLTNQLLEVIPYCECLQIRLVFRGCQGLNTVCFRFRNQWERKYKCLNLVYFSISLPGYNGVKVYLQLFQHFAQYMTFSSKILHANMWQKSTGGLEVVKTVTPLICESR